MGKEPSVLPIPVRPGPSGTPHSTPKAPNHRTSALLPLTPEDSAGKVAAGGTGREAGAGAGGLATPRPSSFLRTQREAPFTQDLFIPPLPSFLQTLGYSGGNWAMTLPWVNPWATGQKAKTTTWTLPRGAHHLAGEKSHAKC